MEPLNHLLKNSEVIIITGKRGAGKTALGMYFLGLSTSPYIVGFPEEKKHLLPSSVSLLPSIDDLPQESTIFIDEAALFFNARESFRSTNKKISGLVTEARHFNQCLIFTSHTLRKLDISIIIDADALIFREPSFLHSKFERQEVKPLMENVKREFSKIESDKREYAFILSHDFEQFVRTPLPSFWSEELSKISCVPLSSPSPPSQRVEPDAQAGKGYIVFDIDGNKSAEYIRRDTAYMFAGSWAKKRNKNFILYCKHTKEQEIVTPQAE